MGLHAASSTELMERFLETNVARSPALRHFSGQQLRITGLFEVRTASIEDIAADSLVPALTVSGWWAFILGQEQEVVGIATIKLTSEALVFDGVDTSSLGRRAAEALRRLEHELGGRDAEAHFMRVSPLFFTAAIAVADGQRWIVAAEGSRSPADLQRFAVERIEAGVRLREVAVDAESDDSIKE